MNKSRYTTTIYPQIFTDYLSFCKAKINLLQVLYYSGPNPTTHSKQGGS